MQAADLARGRWRGLLERFGIDAAHLTGRQVGCPACGGKDRFRFDDKEGRGTFFCSGCGAGDGFDLLARALGWSFRKAAKKIETEAGLVPVVASKGGAQPDYQARLEKCTVLWRQSKAVAAGDAVASYLANRVPGLAAVPSVIRLHPSLLYRDDSISKNFPAMLAKVQDANGKGCALHRTFLNGSGGKADVATPKRVLGNLPDGCAIRLGPVSETLGIAEGIETALAASMLHDVVTWAAVSAGGLERWTPPQETGRVIVFGDSDDSFTGQAAAFSLAKRLRRDGLDVEVRLPERGDWADEILSRRATCAIGGAGENPCV